MFFHQPTTTPDHHYYPTCNDEITLSVTCDYKVLKNSWIEAIA
jgi:hypothetical protein